MSFVSLRFVQPAVIIMLIAVGCTALSAPITRIEYYLDTDPGYGNGTAIPIRQGTSVDTNFIANLTGLANGFHTLAVRACDSTRKWSLVNLRAFFIDRIFTNKQITSAEYFVDVVPGYGVGHQLHLPPGDSTSIYFTVDLTDYATGFHNLYIRVRDGSGRWSLVKVSTFFVDRLPTNSQISGAEYFIDRDPGYGLGRTITITPGTDISTDFIADLTGLQGGYHAIYVRVRDNYGKWSLIKTNSFLLDAIPTGDAQITGAEYFIDRDPGYGLGRSIPVTAGTSINTSFVANLSGLASGYHSLYVRVRDNRGKWSLMKSNSFLLDAIPQGTAEITRAEYFIDRDPGYGLGSAINIPSGNSIGATFYASLNGLSLGFHALYARIQDNFGKWSLTNTKMFLVEPVPVANPQITGAEYFINTDPGYGLGHAIPVRSGISIDTSFIADLSGYANGLHTLCVRTRDSSGKWSLYYEYQFRVVTAPQAPRYLIISYLSPNAVLNWTAAPGDTVDGYRIYRNTTGGYFTPPGQGTQIGTVNGTTTTYTDPNVSGHFYYRVIAYRN